jgi:hypothetical protein
VACPSTSLPPDDILLVSRNMAGSMGATHRYLADEDMVWAAWLEVSEVQAQKDLKCNLCNWCYCMSIETSAS